MKQRNPFSPVLEFYSDTREKIIIYKEKYPERVIGLMFLILLVAVTIFLISKATRQDSYSGSAQTLVKRISAPTAAAAGKVGQPATTDVMSLLGLYGKAKSINPDSLTLKDSLLLKEINQDLNQILK